MNELAISFDDILSAHQRIAGIAHRTPVLTSTIANEMTEAQVYFKCESFQRMGAFKFRGTYNAIAQFTPGKRTKGVIAYSSGNHAQAIALAARLIGVRAIIVMPSHAPDIKIAATQRSFQSGKIVHIDTPGTIADGAQTQHLSQYTFPVLRKLVDDIITVSYAQLVDAMKFFAGRMKIFLEPTGCLGAAAVFRKKVDVRGKKVGIVLSGGNIDLACFAALVTAS